MRTQLVVNALVGAFAEQVEIEIRDLGVGQFDFRRNNRN
jgi:hypothetical protein